MVSALELDGRQLRIRSANYAPVSVPVIAVESVEVSQYSAIKTILLTNGIILGITGAALAIAFAAI